MQNSSNSEELHLFFYPKSDKADKEVSKKLRKSRSCIAAIYNKESNSLSFGMSICSKKDVFVKKVGRVKAIGRAKYSIPILTKYPIKEKPLVTQFLEACVVLERVMTSQGIGENKMRNKIKKLEQEAA